MISQTDVRIYINTPKTEKNFFIFPEGHCFVWTFPGLLHISFWK